MKISFGVFLVCAVSVLAMQSSLASAPTIEGAIALAASRNEASVNGNFANSGRFNVITATNRIASGDTSYSFDGDGAVAAEGQNAGANSAIQNAISVADVNLSEPGLVLSFGEQSVSVGVARNGGSVEHNLDYPGYISSSPSGPGGNGGNGGNGGATGYVAGGSGGAGGTGGSAISGTSFIITNNSAITGGFGGLGGDGGLTTINGFGGAGGAGGTGGSAVSGTSFTITNNSGGTITGGNGGYGGIGGTGNNGIGGTGGVGVVSTGGSTITNAGTISGGKADGGLGVQADAVALSGGGNTLILESGYVFNGNVVSTSGTTNGGDTLELGGSTSATFNTSTIGSTATFQGFNNYVANGASGTTWTLTNTTTAVTPWQVNGGTLSISSDSNLGASTGGLTLNGGTLLTTATITDNRAITLGANGGVIDNAGYLETFGGVIGGSGALTLEGTGGNIILTNNNSYSGGTTIMGGTVVNIEKNNSLGANTGTITFVSSQLSIVVPNITIANAIDLTGQGTNIYIVNSGGSDALSGNIAGSGGLDVGFYGSGTATPMTISGTNTYSGGTSIDNGTVSISHANNLGTGVLTVINGTLETTASVQLANDIAVTNTGYNATINNDGHNDSFSGSIVGLGSMTFTGAGTTTLSGSNSYDGGTTVSGGGTLSISSDSNLGASTGGLTLNGGTLQARAALTTARRITIGSTGGGLVGTNQASLDPTTSTALTLTGSLSGTGSLQTAGTIIDNGSGGSSGGTTVTSGLLAIGDASTPTASLTSNVTVDSGAYLRGHGTVIGNVTNNGTVFPGGTIGILTINGNYTQAATGTLDIEVTPNDTHGVGHDPLSVTGSAALAGTLAVQVNSSYIVGEKYNIVQAANGVSGTFTQTTYNPLFAAYISPEVTYGTNDAILVLKANPLAFTSGSGVEVSPCIVNQSLFGALSTVLDGSQSLGGTTPHFTDLHQGAWLKGAGDFGQTNGASVADFGGITGYGKTLSRHMVVGGAFSGLGTTTNTPLQSLNGQSFGVYGYGIYTRGALRISASVGAGALSQDSQRNLNPTGLIATGSTSGWFTDTGVQAQYLIPLGCTFLMPYGSATYLHTHLNGFSEQGAGSLDLTYGSQAGNLGEFTGGVRTGIDLTDHALTITPWVELGGTGTAGNRTLTTTETLGVTNTTAVGQIAPAASLDVGAGVTVTSDGPWAARLAYAGQFAGTTYLNTFDLLGRYRF